MDEDKFALVEKIIKDIGNVMSKNAELCSFEIVPVDTNFRNKSPVLHLENCLGLESWCVKHVYMYCYSELMDKYFVKPNRKVNKVSSVQSDRLASLLDVTLLLNPDLSTLWNKRRELVLKSSLEKSSELHFARLVLSRKPKCNDAFVYRRWILSIIFQDNNIQSNYIENLTDEELNICELASGKYPNNYHSWNHRMWLLKKLKDIEKQFNLDVVYIKEYNFSERWTSKHVSDFSCFHYRQFCIKNIFQITTENLKIFRKSLNVNLRKNFFRLISIYLPNNVTIQSSEEDFVSCSEEKLLNILLCHTFKNCKCIVDHVSVCMRLEVLFHELALNNDLLRFYKHHETLWYHRRFVIHEVIFEMYNYFGLMKQNGSLTRNLCKKCNLEDLTQKQAKIVRYDSNRIYSCVLFNVLLSHEKKFVEERRLDCDNYADRHEKYFKFVEGLNNIM